MQFDDHLVLVTGGASGIGLAIARQFLAEGARVIVTDLSEVGLKALNDENNPSLISRRSDAADVDEIGALADWIHKEHGPVDTLINNAGFARLADPESVSLADYEAQMKVLLTGPVFYVQHLADMLRKSDNGSVVNISSASALISVPGYCPYALAKAALVKFTEDSVLQVPGIRHNAVLPGFIDTPILSGIYGDGAVEGLRQSLKAMGPVPRMGTPTDIANAVLFLASKDAAYVNGSHLVVDGGISRLNSIVSVTSGQVQPAA